MCKAYVFLLLLTPASYAQHLIRGRVLDAHGEPLGYVNVFFNDGDFAGDVSNDQGLFEIKSKVTGRRKLVASMIGYERIELTISVPSSDQVLLRLPEKAIDFKEIRIEASAYTGGEGKVTLTKVDVYTTPGGAADVFQSLKALPGITQTDETAALPVRGGNPSEVGIFINQAPLRHPYHGENTNGTGLFSIVETAAVKRLYFSSGAFSSKYGNALSGILDIETESRIEKNRYQLDANLVSAGAGIQQVIVDRRLSTQFYLKHTSTNLLFRLNEPSVEVVQDPTSTTATGLLNYTYSNSGVIQLTAIASRDAQVFRLPILANQNRYDLETSHQIVGARWSDVLQKTWYAKASLSYSGFTQNLTFYPWRKDNREGVIDFRTDNTLELGSTTTLLLGMDARREDYRFNTLFPRRRGEFYSGADSLVNHRSQAYVGGGVYAEVQQRLFYRTTAFLGGRVDYHDLTGGWTRDIRTGVVRELSKTTFLRLAAGTFHQIPDASYDELRRPAAKLHAMQAKHVVAGLEENRGSFQARIEVYGKWYSSLLQEDGSGYLVNTGNGYAYGADAFLKGSLGKTSGWISYSLIRTRRQELEVESLRPTAYDITHNVKLIQKTNLGKGFEISSTFRYASGRPYTPIVGSMQAIDGHFDPIYGERFGGRLPDFIRLDARLSRFTFFGDGHYLVLYIEALNILDHKNLLDYGYSEDFSQRQNILSYFARRTVVAGFSLSY